jgi:hypothetical protein
VQLFEAYLSLDVGMSIELRGSQIAYVRDLRIGQSLLASLYETKRRRRFHAQMLAFRIRILTATLAPITTLLAPQQFTDIRQDPNLED